MRKISIVLFICGFVFLFNFETFGQGEKINNLKQKKVKLITNSPYAVIEKGIK